ncbi:MAG: PAS domain-containing protein [Gemmatimonadaceae bacterium]|nr:PAS domain-containing protein [Gemmatimonadaceae bacterium]
MPSASLRNRLLAVAAAATAPFVVYLAVSAGREKTLARTALHDDVLTRARAVASLMDERLRTVDDLLDSAMVQAARPGIGDRRIEIVDPRPNPLATTLTIAVLDSAGRRRRTFLGDADRVTAVPAERRAALVAPALAGRAASAGSALPTIVDEGLSRAAADSIAMIIVRPLLPRAVPCACLADTIGAVVALLSDKGIQSLLGSDTLPENAVAVLLGRSGEPLGRIARPARWIDRGAGDSSVLATGGQRDGVISVRGGDDASRLVGFATLERRPWRVYVGLPSEAAMAGSNDRLRDLALLALVALAIAGFGVTIVLRAFTAPVQTLIADARRLGAGALSHRSTVAESDGDLGQLGAALNAMASELEARRKVTQEDLQRALQVFEDSPVAMWIADASADGAASCRITRANAAAARLLGVSVGSLMGQRDGELVDAVGAPLVAPVAAGEDPPPTRSGPATLLTADGTRRGCTLTVTHFTDQSTPMRLVTAQEATSGAGAGGGSGARVTHGAPDLVGFAGQVADQFSDVLVGMSGFTQFAIENEHDPDMRAMALKRMSELSGRGLTVARQLQCYGGRGMSHRGAVSLNDAITGTLRSMHGTLGKDVVLDLRLTTAGSSIWSDPAIVQDAVTALLVNAREAMPRGGTLTVATTLAEVPDDRSGRYPAPAGRYVVLTIADTGVGMGSEAQRRMFDPFYTTQQRRGAGLGLAAVAGIAREHAWVISVESEPKVGTAISIYMPLAATEAGTRPPTGAQSRRVTTPERIA